MLLHPILSTRGIPLALDSTSSFPCLAVEMYCKWYSLYLVQGTMHCATVTPWLPDPKLEDTLGSWIFGDHIFNPRTLRLVRKPAPIDSRSWELIVGRYVTVALEQQFPDMQEYLYHHEEPTTTQQGNP